MSAIGRGVLAVTDQPMIRSLFTGTAAGRRLSHRFVAGETLDDVAVTARELNDLGAQVSLDHLGEHVAQPGEAIAARDAYLAALDRIQRDDLEADVSVKLTQLGLGFDAGLAVRSLSELAVRAAAVGTTITVDMEESSYTEATVSAFEAVQSAHGNLGIAVQSYLYRTRADLERIMPRGGHVRLCKGAYAEPVDVAFQSRKRVDANFDALLALLMESSDLSLAIATHDDARIEMAQRFASSRSAPWEFQMLYGVRRRLQLQLLADGFSLRVYVPYGTAWYPYLTRRLAERPANLLFFARAVLGR